MFNCYNEEEIKGKDGYRCVSMVNIMKKCNKLIASVLVVLSLFVLFCGSLSVSAEVVEETVRTTTDPYFAEATTCTCEDHMNMYTTTVPESEPGFSLGEDDMTKISELGEEVKGVGGIFHSFFAKFYEILNKILELFNKIPGLSGSLEDFIK